MDGPRTRCPRRNAIDARSLIARLGSGCQRMPSATGSAARLDSRAGPWLEPPAVGPNSRSQSPSTRVRTVALRRMNDSVVVKVKPGSRKGSLVEVGPGGELTIYVRQRAVDGKANDAVTRLLAAHLQLPRSRVELVSGTTSRLKRFRVSR
jgi:uncharacterized protein YggU (UPF0235/DUF167 family)